MLQKIAQSCLPYTITIRHKLSLKYKSKATYLGKPGCLSPKNDRFYNGSLVHHGLPHAKVQNYVGSVNPCSRKSIYL